MKKLIILLLLVGITLTGFSQGLFKPVTMTSGKVNNNNLSAIVPVTQKWAWRIDASVALVEINYNKDTKQFVSNSFSAVGPAIGYQHYVVKAGEYPSPFNNYGFSAAALLGKSIYDPNLAEFKVALVVNIMEYFKLGVTYTPNPATYISPVGFFFGGGITF
jgi:hypothetical protein